MTLSSTRVQMVEDHAEAITERVVLRIQRDARLREIGRLPESELRARARDLAKNLGRWLVSKDEEIEKRYEDLGHQRFQESIPLHETVHALHIIKEEMIDFVRDQGVAQTTVQMYAEEELEYCVNRFFDQVVYHFVRGYERALRRAAHLPLPALIPSSKVGSR